MSFLPKVSIIIPVYNVEQYLKQCLDSLLKQTFSNIELICVDDGSTDNSLAILQEYASIDERVKIITQDNRGAGAARNVGMSEAKGEYLYFMDSDDYCSIDFLQKTIDYIEKKKLDILVFNYCKFDEVTGKKEYRDGLVKARCPQDKDVFSYKDIPNVICKVVNPTPWNKLYKHEFIKENKLRWLEVSTTNDITFATMSVLVAKRIGYLDDTFLYYRVNLSGSITSKKKYKQDNVIKAVLSVNEQAKELPHYEEVKNSIREFIVSNLINALKNYTPDDNTSYHLEFRRKIDAIFYAHPLFSNYETYQFHDKKVYASMEEYRLRALTRKDYTYAPRVIVSLTSFPQRIGTVYIALSSIYQQTKRPDIVILWLAESQFPNKEDDLPIELLDYKDFGLQIRWCEEDIRPHKKYYYAMKEYPEDIVITIDDDLTYDSQMIEKLFASYLKYPNAVSTVRTHLIKGDERGNIAPYAAWTKEFSGLIGKPSMQLFSTSGAGTLYPPHCMDDEVFNIEAIKKLCLNADDLWLKMMQVRKSTPVVLVDRNRLLRYIPDTQEIALRQVNVYQDGNEEQLRNILSTYDIDNEFSALILGDNIEDENIEKSGKYAEKSLLQQDSVLMETQRRLEKVENELKMIKSSHSLRIGMKITFIPRRFKVMLHCYEEFGLRYTMSRVKDHFVIFLKNCYGSVFRKR